MAFPRCFVAPFYCLHGYLQTVIMVRLLPIAFILAFLVASMSASTLAIKVTVTQGTLAVGTNVSVVRDGVELEMKKAGPDGYATFEVLDGSYFVLLRRYPYPLHVSLVDVQGNTNITLTMRQLVSYASVYGQVSGPPAGSNISVSAHASGVQVKRAYANSQGMYIISFLPEDNYDIAFESDGYEKAVEKEFLPSADFKEVNVKLSPPAPVQLPEYSLVAPDQVPQYSSIEARLLLGQQPAAGEKVSVSTPEGTLEATTDSQGIARVNGARAGEYTFYFGNLSATSRVVAPEVAPPEVPTSPPPTAPPETPDGKPADYNGLLAAAGVALVVIIVLAALAAVFLKGAGKKKHQHHRKGE